MTKKEIHEKLRAGKALRGVTIFELVASDHFLGNLDKYLASQKADREGARASFEAMKRYGLRGMKLPAHSVDYFLDWTTVQFAQEYLRVISETSALPASKRKYIQQLGNQAFNLTLLEIASEEFPELKEEIKPITQKN